MTKQEALAVFEGVPLDEEFLEGNRDDEDGETEEAAAGERNKHLDPQVIFVWMCVLCALLFVVVQLATTAQQFQNKPTKDMPMVMRTRQPLETKSLAAMETARVVPKLTIETYDTFLANNQHAIILFYTSWCDICQREVPIWEEFGERVSLPEEGLPVGVARVKCADQMGDTCRKDGIMAFPTIRWINQGGSKSFEFFGHSSVDNFMRFSRKMLGLSSGDGVAELVTQETFDDFLAQNRHAFVLFTISRSVRSRRVAPVWEEFGERVALKDLPVGVAHVDCTAQANICDKSAIMAFPTMRWFEGGQHLQDYRINRTVDAFMDYSLKMLGEKPENSCCDYHWIVVPHPS